MYLVVIPKNYTSDIHICGRCKIQYTSLTLFLKHKETCFENEFKENNQEQFTKKVDVENLIEISALDTFQETIEKDNNQINVLNNLMVKDQCQLRQCKIECFDEQGLCVNQNDSTLKGNNLPHTKTVLLNGSKRSLQNDEEDIATLLANQLSSETSTDDLNTDVELQSDRPLIETYQNKEKKDNTSESKIMYRGKMRKLFRCQVEGCSYSTLLRKDINRHSRVHTGEKPFKCFLCEKAFNRTDKLLLHQRIHAGDKRYKCTKCEYASVDSGSLIKHLRVHNGERPFKCQLCSYRARDSSQLTVHLRSHTGDSPFICTNVKCKAAFKTNSDLKRHMVVHSEEKPHSCMYCSYKSTLKRNLQIHIQSQHPNGELKEYKCHLCPMFTLPTSRKLKNHIKKSHSSPEEKPPPNQNSADVNSPTDGLESQEIYKKRKRKSKRNMEKIPVGVMTKAYDCKLCEASFVCQDSLVTHQRYHSKVEGELRKSELNQIMEKKEKSLNGDSAMNGGCVVDNSFSDSLKNAEILASLNSPQNIRQYVMIAPDAVQNVYNTEEYVLVQN